MTYYANQNFKTKKALKEAVNRGAQVMVREMTPMGERVVTEGERAVSGPWYPEPHKWYACVVVKDDVIVRVK